ncbi:MAG: PmoA family protein [Pirellulales bacterium]
MHRAVCLPGLAVAFFLLAASAKSAEFETTQVDGGVVINVDGKLFAEYQTLTGAKPIVWPIIGPTGVEMTRTYPMRLGIEGEKKDHPHQRSLWFTHGEVNGINFWAETRGHGNIIHTEWVKVEGGPQATLITKNDWVAPDSKKQLEDERKLVFRVGEDWRSIDFDITLKATDGPVQFGDTKEGTMGIRLPTSMDVDSKLGGRIINSDGLIDAEAWGKPAPWVDYQGPVGGQTVGVAIMNHPSSFRYPTYWHVRNYGLFAANPFGLHDFTQSSEIDGAYTLPAGEAITLRYRILFHLGDEQRGKIAEAFEAYQQEP